MGIKKFGVLYLDGKIVQPGTSCSDLVSGQKTVERIVAFGDSQSEESKAIPHNCYDTHYGAAIL